MARHPGVVAKFKAARHREGDDRCDVCQWSPPPGLSEVCDERHKLMHAHHVVPLACGGKDHPDNLVHLCPNCHSIAHRLGRMTRVVDGWPNSKWHGAQTPAELVATMNELICTPDKWAAIRERHRKVATAERQKREREQRIRMEEPEALRRRASIREIR